VNPIIQTPVANPTAWTVQPSGIEPVPNGSYFAEFVSVEPFSNAEKGIENKVRFSWKVLGGPQAGRNITALCDVRFTPATHAGRLVTGMAGRPLQVGENVLTLVDTFVGKRFLAVVSPGPKGGKPSVQSAAATPEM